MQKDSFSRFTGLFSIFLSLLTLGWGDNLLSKFPDWYTPKTLLFTQVTGGWLLMIGLLSAVFCLLGPERESGTGFISSTVRIYLSCVVVILGVGSLWDAFTTLLGIMQIFETTAPATSEAMLLIPSLVSTSIIYLCILIPAPKVLSGDYSIFLKLPFAGLFTIAFLFDFLTSALGNAKLLLGVGTATDMLRLDIETCNVQTVVVVSSITLFSTIAPTFLAIVLTRHVQAS
jgi:hypothetical protein